MPIVDLATKPPARLAASLLLLVTMSIGSAWSASSDQAGAAALTTPCGPLAAEDLELSVSGVIVKGVGKPRAVAEIGRDRVLVLDSDWKRVSIHSVTRDEQVGTIGNGYGSGPGQFALPVDMVVSDTVVHVFDYELRRVSQFSTQGRFLRDVPISGAAGRTMTYQGGRYWFKLMDPKNWKVLGIADASGTVAAFAAALDEHERVLFEAGVAGGITASAAGDQVIYVNGDASTLTWFRGAEAVRQVQLLPPTVVFDKARNGRKLPWLVATRSSGGVASLGDTLFAVLTAETEVPATVNSTRGDRPMLSVFDRSGKLRGRTSIAGHGLALSISVGRHSGGIYVSFTGTPSGKIVKFAVTPTAKGGTTR
jgi:hypothetical protein